MAAAGRTVDIQTPSIGDFPTQLPCLKVTGGRRVGWANRMDSQRPSLSQKSVILALWILPFMSDIRMIWSPVASSRDDNTKIAEECSPRWAGITLAEKVRLVLSSNTVVLGKGQITGLVGTDDLHSSSCMSRQGKTGPASQTRRVRAHG